MLHSFAAQPVFNSENHFIRDGAGPESISPDHTRSVLWQGALHHQAATTIWAWEEANSADLSGSIYFRPANVYAAGRTMLDINRLAPEVAAINRHRPRIAILYAVPSIYWQPDYPRSVQDAMAAVQFLGQPVTFISEKQLAESRRSPANKHAELILVPAATHVRQPTLDALTTFAAAGGRVVLLGHDCLKWNEYHHPLPDAPPNSALSIDAATGDRQLAAALLPVLASANLPCGYLTDNAGRPAFGVEYRAVPQDGEYLVPMINHLSTPLVVRLAPAGTATDLLNQEPVDLSTITLNPMQPRLLRVAAETLDPPRRPAKAEAGH